MESVKYRCNNCGYSEKYKWNDRVVKILRELFCVIGIISVTLSLIYFMLTGNSVELAAINNVVNSDFNSFAKQYDEELRDVALNLTADCSGGYSYCFAIELFNGLENLRYVPTSNHKILYHPMYVYNTNAGDCRNVASLYVGLMHSLGFDAYVDCDFHYRHCVAVVPLKNSWEHTYDDYMVVDLTKPDYYFMDSTQDTWVFLDE